ncbi:SDR family oxidoreductase [Flavobacteriaceae bacterium]|nr:SDR family oxidoreductase [Flavobacteriaceae bacterium]MDA9015124.1 SDR family oxidoreductase [Flavobacteriaceae bacterium]MDA9843966.1 SDR family oxidoreductase [Flavobacteriaceae bacterium]
MFEIQDKVIVITGATGALGGALALSLAKAKAQLVILGRNQELLDELSSKLNTLTVVKTYTVNVMDRMDLIRVREEMKSHFDRIDVLINAVGGNLPGAVIPDDKSIFDLSETDFDQVVDLNLKGTLLPSIVFGEVMSQKGKGSIINYSSMAVDRVITRVLGYSASKAAMENFTRWMAVEMALKFGDGIRVNAIAPGFFIGKQNRDLLLNKDGSLTSRGEKIIRNTPMQRFGEAEELNGPIHFLCSDSASFVTGIVLPVDGGFGVFSGV